LSHSRIYLFQETDLNERDKEFLSNIVNKHPMNKEEILDGLKWDEEVLLKTMKKLQKCKVLRIEHEKIVVPGLVQKGKK
jgi:Cu2+-containing amine oxidase